MSPGSSSAQSTVCAGKLSRDIVRNYRRRLLYLEFAKILRSAGILAVTNKSCYPSCSSQMIGLRVCGPYHRPINSEASESKMIRHHSFAFLFFGCALALGVFIAGCGQSSPKVSQTDMRPAPEKSFDEIALIVKSALETGAGGIQAGFVSDQPNARSHFSVHNDVSSELIRPTNADESYRAKITVKSHTLYSLRHLPDSDKKNDSDKKKPQGKDAGSNPLLDDTQGTKSNGGADVPDDSASSSTSKSPRPLPGRPDDAVSSLPDEDSRTYDLVYENGRWALKTPLDLKTELSVKNAFDYALKLQPHSP
jgi:hypothetical protein